MKCFGGGGGGGSDHKFRKHVKIVLLDDQEIIQEVQRTTKGQELLDNVFKYLNIIETSYFGIRFLDSKGQAHWLHPGKNVHKQLHDNDPAVCYFGVKFYAADPCRLLEEITRYQFFLQVKKDILLGRLSVANELAAQLGAYAIQSELGDYDPKQHVKGYVSEFRFVPHQTMDLEEKIGDLHQQMMGYVPAVAELHFLEKVKWLDMYGVDLHPVLGEDKIDYFLGLTPSGITVLRNKNKVGNYFWPRITKITMKGRYFMIRVKNRAEEETHGFETPSKSACKHLWGCAIDHHAFFKLVQNAPEPSTNFKKPFAMSNRFRSSNRSNASSTSRRRAQPQFIRTPSKRYNRRFVEGSESQASPGDSRQPPGPIYANTATPKSTENPTSTHWKRTNSPDSIKSVPVFKHQQSYQVPSPKSTRSASRKRSKSIDSHSSGDEHSHRRRSSERRHRSRRKHKGSSSHHGKSDAESDVSTNTRGSRKHRSKRREEKSGSESEDASAHRRRRHRHRSSSKHQGMIEWKEATMTTVQQSVSSVKTIGNEGPDLKEPAAREEQPSTRAATRKLATVETVYKNTPIKLSLAHPDSVENSQYQSSTLKSSHGGQNGYANGHSNGGVNTLTRNKDQHPSQFSSYGYDVTINGISGIKIDSEKRKLPQVTQVDYRFITNGSSNPDAGGKGNTEFAAGCNDLSLRRNKKSRPVENHNQEARNYNIPTWKPNTFPNSNVSNGIEKIDIGVDRKQTFDRDPNHRQFDLRTATLPKPVSNGINGIHITDYPNSTLERHQISRGRTQVPEAVQVHNRLQAHARSRSSSLEMILSPLVSSTDTNRTRL